VAGTSSEITRVREILSETTCASIPCVVLVLPVCPRPEVRAAGTLTSGSRSWRAAGGADVEEQNAENVSRMMESTAGRKLPEAVGSRRTQAGELHLENGFIAITKL